MEGRKPKSHLLPELSSSRLIVGDFQLTYAINAQRSQPLPPLAMTPEPSTKLDRVGERRKQLQASVSVSPKLEKGTAASRD